ncbi:MAG: phosphatase PAP2 family protein [Dehalococcoidia bacterium]|nr:MAG: phosphatase PAP2 family protein [Dehalococcoidia bacterium]
MPPLAGWTLWITGFVGKAPALDSIMRFLANDFMIPVAIALVMLVLWLGHPDQHRREQLQRVVMNASVAIGISTLVVRILNVYDFWPRPFLVENDAIRESATRAAETVFYLPHDPTFPSNAATISFAAATGIFLGHRSAACVMYGLAFLWVFARFYAGIHFFIDIAGGIMIGIITSLMISKVFMPRTEPVPTLALKLARYLYIA